MSEHIVVNEKKYLPSNTLAGTFGYTSNYISKLAREEKVLGLQIDRIWFVEPASLESYLQKIAIEKEIKKEELRVQRKKERETYEQVTTVRSERLFAKTHTTITLAQTLAVLLCGIFGGVLFWASASEGITPQSVIFSAGKTASFIASSLTPTFSNFESGTYKNLPYGEMIAYRSRSGSDEAKVSSQVFEQKETKGESKQEVRFTLLPTEETFNVEESKMADEQNAMPEGLKFSDEVRVVTDAQGEQYLEPVFREGSEGVRFILTTENEKGETQ